jgi:hypothetical protein
MASSGLCHGALTTLPIRDIDRIEKYHLLKFTVYKRDQESYIVYCTPECTLIDQYLGWRQNLGE